MKKRVFSIILCNILVLAMTARGQYRETEKDQACNLQLTGSLQYDIIVAADNAMQFSSSDSTGTAIYEKRYSPLRAAFFSALIPGAGQLYTKSYLQSAAFFGAEVLTWVLYAVYQKNGDRQTVDFQNYANGHWSALRYAQWISQYYPEYYISGIVQGNTVDWSELNACEDRISQQTNPETGFSHRLAPYGDQQYYEMIGKYSQFGGGWDDAATFKTGGFTKEDVIANNGVGNVSPGFLEYRDMREKANSYYNIATTVSFVIVANHVLSALEAAWNASSINHRIQLEGHIQSRVIYGSAIEFVPTLHLTYEL
jgi:hypothetical protein